MVSGSRRTAAAARQICLLVAIGGLFGAGRVTAAEVSPSGPSPAAKRPFTTRDAIEMSYFGDLWEGGVAIDSLRTRDNGFFSPDGRNYVKLSHRGILSSNVMESTLWLFDVAETRAYVNAPHRLPKPEAVALVRMSGAVNGGMDEGEYGGNIIMQPQWSADSRHLAFRACGGGETRHLFVVDVASHNLAQVSDADQDVTDFTWTGDALTYLAKPPVNEGEAWWSSGVGIPDIQVGTGSSLIDLLYPNMRRVVLRNSSAQLWQVRAGKPIAIAESPTPYFVQKGGSWISVDPRHPLPNDRSSLTIAIRQSVNAPPVLVATDKATGKSAVIFDPNPQLAKIDLGEASVYRWHDGRARTLTGGLVKPPGYQPTHRYPLVVQTHGFDPKAFLRVGGTETAQSARALAGRGIVVLQVQEPGESSVFTNTPREAYEDGTLVYLAAVDQLVAEGVVDPRKVGIAGMSRTGMYVITSLVRASDRFAAAVFADGDSGTLWTYLSIVDYWSADYLKSEEDFYAGVKPYGSGLERWIKDAPGFNTDKIRAPVLFSAADPQHLIMSVWPLYAQLRDQNKPTDLLYIRSGRHGLAKPAHRLAHQEMLVDWFDYWLQGKEDPDPAKVEQYRRWHALRKDPTRPMTGEASAVASPIGRSAKSELE